MKKVIVIVRTRDEEAMIGRFCRAYQWADHILVADGGSLDRTVDIATSFPNVRTRNFFQVVQSPNGFYHNPDGLHSNFLIEWAKEFSPDWIIFDDCDSIPTLRLQEDARSILELVEWNCVFVRRFYVWIDGKSHFPALDVGASMWAWKPANLHVRANKANDFHPVLNPLPAEYEFTCMLNDPYRLLHYSWRSEEQIQRKLAMYKDFGIAMQHPLESCGELAALPEWAVPE